jgi:hypothetical protein
LTQDEIAALLHEVDGTKDDDGKRQWHLLPLSLLEDTVDVLMFGAKKYGVNNWRNVKNGHERYYDALMRHISAWKQGEVVDPDTGISHLAHAMCNLIFLHELR